MGDDAMKNMDRGVDECGGVGDVCGNPYFWMPTSDTECTATFINGNALRFPNNRDGWIDFVSWAFFTGGVFFPVDMDTES